MPGAPDSLYVLARTALLDALEALGPQRDAVILVGAQAIYLHTGAIELAVPEYTTDADVVIDPALLRTLPELEQALTSAGFFRGPRVGAWAITKQLNDEPVDVEIDLMVPEAVGGPGRRAARLSGHKGQLARKARGLEAALVDKSTFVVGAMHNADARSYPIAVAGPAALMVSKLHKIGERLAEGKVHRLDDKDALDVLRLLRAIPTRVLAGAFLALIDDAIAKVVTMEALASLKTQFATSTGAGSLMAARAAGPLAALDSIAASCAVLTMDLLQAIGG